MGRFFLGSVSLRVCIFAGLLASMSLHASDLAKAEERYRHTDFEASLATLDKHSSDAATNFLVATKLLHAGGVQEGLRLLANRC